MLNMGYPPSPLFHDQEILFSLEQTIARGDTHLGIVIFGKVSGPIGRGEPDADSAAISAATSPSGALHFRQLVQASSLW